MSVGGNENIFTLDSNTILIEPSAGIGTAGTSPTVSRYGGRSRPSPLVSSNKDSGGGGRCDTLWDFVLNRILEDPLDINTVKGINLALNSLDLYTKQLRSHLVNNCDFLPPRFTGSDADKEEIIILSERAQESLNLRTQLLRLAPRKCATYGRSYGGNKQKVDIFSDPPPVGGSGFPTPRTSGSSFYSKKRKTIPTTQNASGVTAPSNAVIITEEKSDALKHRSIIKQHVVVKSEPTEVIDDVHVDDDRDEDFEPYSMNSPSPVKRGKAVYGKQDKKVTSAPKVIDITNKHKVNTFLREFAETLDNPKAPRDIENAEDYPNLETPHVVESVVEIEEEWQVKKENNQPFKVQILSTQSIPQSSVGSSSSSSSGAATITNVTVPVTNVPFVAPTSANTITIVPAVSANEAPQSSAAITQQQENTSVIANTKSLKTFAVAGSKSKKLKKKRKLISEANSGSAGEIKLSRPFFEGVDEATLKQIEEMTKDKQGNKDIIIKKVTDETSTLIRLPTSNTSVRVHCKDCNEILNNPYEIRVHASKKFNPCKTDNSQLVIMEECEFCGCLMQYLPKSKPIESHREWHEKYGCKGHGITAEPIACRYPNCNEILDNFFEYRHHARRVHNSEYVPCKLCYKLMNFRGGRTFKSHLESSHVGLVAKEKIKRIRKKKESKAQPIEYIRCEVCHKILRKASYKSHRLQHMNIEPSLPCNICEKLFKTEGHLRAHNKAVHEKHKRIKCPKCPRRFNTIELQQRHSDTCKLTRTFKCTMCSNAYFYRSDLKTHVFCAHATRYPWQCKFCGSKMKLVENMIAHVHKTHHVERAKARDYIEKIDDDTKRLPV